MTLTEICCVQFEVSRVDFVTYIEPEGRWIRSVLNLRLVASDAVKPVVSENLLGATLIAETLSRIFLQQPSHDVHELC